MLPKSGLPKRAALRNMPKFEHGMRANEDLRKLRTAHRRKRKTTKATVVSLFCGCGGLDVGMLGGFDFLGSWYPELPFKLIGAYDNDHRAIDTYRLNIGDEGVVQDLTNLNLRELPGAEVLTGGFPCQDFSSCGPKTGFQGERGLLYRVMVDYMQSHSPKVVVGENVPYLAKLSGGSLVEKILFDFEMCGYKFDLWTLYCPDYGLPQSRTRLFLIGVRNDIYLSHGMPQQPDPSFFMSPRTIDDALDDLMGITDETIPNQSQYFVATKASAGAGQGDQKNKSGEVSYAIRANPKARVQFHHKLDRRLTVRECARLQSFPDEFVFPFSTSANVKQIGNAVPPIVGHAVAVEIADYLQRTGHLSVAKESSK